MGNYYLAWACLGLTICVGILTFIIAIQCSQIKDMQYDIDKTINQVNKLADITAANFEHFEKLAAKQRNYFNKW